MMINPEQEHGPLNRFFLSRSRQLLRKRKARSPLRGRIVISHLRVEPKSNRRRTPLESLRQDGVPTFPLSVIPFLQALLSKDGPVGSCQIRRVFNRKFSSARKNLPPFLDLLFLIGLPSQMHFGFHHQCWNGWIKPV